MDDSDYMSDEEQAQHVAENQKEALLEYVSNLDPTYLDDQEVLAYAFRHLFDEWGEPRE